MGRVTLSCPNCKQKVAVTRPDSLHPRWSYDKPQENKVEADLIEQVYACKNPDCNSNFAVYWYETRMFIDRA